MRQRALIVFIVCWALPACWAIPMTNHVFSISGTYTRSVDLRVDAPGGPILSTGNYVTQSGWAPLQQTISMYNPGSTNHTVLATAVISNTISRTVQVTLPPTAFSTITIPYYAYSEQIDKYVPFSNTYITAPGELPTTGLHDVYWLFTNLDTSTIPEGTIYGVGGNAVSIGGSISAGISGPPSGNFGPGNPYVVQGLWAVATADTAPGGEEAPPDVAETVANATYFQLQIDALEDLLILNNASLTLLTHQVISLSETVVQVATRLTTAENHITSINNTLNTFMTSTTDTLNTILSDVAQLTTDITTRALNSALTTVAQQTSANTAAINATQIDVATLQTDVTALQTSKATVASVDALSDTVAGLSATLSVAQSNVTEALTLAQQAVASIALLNVTDGLTAGNISSVATTLVQLQDSLSVLSAAQTTLASNSTLAALEQIVNTKATIADLATVQGDLAAVEAVLPSLATSTLVASVNASLSASLQSAQNDIVTINAALPLLAQSSSVDDVNSTLQTAQANIAALTSALPSLASGSSLSSVNATLQTVIASLSSASASIATLTSTTTQNSVNITALSTALSLLDVSGDVSIQNLTDVSNAVGALDARLITAESAITTKATTAEVGALETQITNTTNALDARLTTAEAGIISKASSVSVAALQSQVTSVAADVATRATQDSVTTLSGSVSALQSNVTSWLTSQSVLAEAVVTAQNDIDSQETAFTLYSSTSNNRFGVLETFSAVAETEIDELQGDVLWLNSTLLTLMVTETPPPSTTASEIESSPPTPSSTAAPAPTTTAPPATTAAPAPQLGGSPQDTAAPAPTPPAAVTNDLAITKKTSSAALVIACVAVGCLLLFMTVAYAQHLSRRRNKSKSHSI